MNTALKPKKIMVHFEDLGQDFTKWEIENGVVTDCQPFQAWLWVGTKVLNEEVKPGCKLEIMGKAGKVTRLKYKVEKVVIS